MSASDADTCHSHRLQPLLAPRSIAIVGASPREGSFGRGVLDACLSAGFEGHVYPVNPNYQDVRGLPCFASLAELPEGVDHAILNVPNQRLEATVDAAITAGIPAVSIFASCYVEGDAQPRLLDRLKARARESGLLVCGGNGMGFYNRVHKVRSSLGGYPREDAGEVAMIAQSGSIYAGLIQNDGRLGFNLTVSSGQEIAVSAADYMDFALELPSTRAIGLFLETIRDPGAFMVAMEKANARGVPVVAVKAARTAAAVEMAKSHSGALAGNDAAYRALFDRTSVLRCRDMDEMIATLQVVSQTPSPGPGGLAAITDSGGEREHLADLADDAGVPFARIGDATISKLAERLDYGLEPSNPLDAWGTGQDYAAIFRDCMSALMEDPDTAIGLWIADLRDTDGYRGPFVEAAPKIAAACGKPLMFATAVPMGPNQDYARRLRQEGVPLLEGIGPAITAVRHALARRDFLARPAMVLPAAPAAAVIQRWRGRLAEGAVSDEATALELIAAFGIAAAVPHRASSRDQAIAAAEKAGFPVALKTAMPGIQHKSDVGGVALGLHDGSAVAAAWDDMAARLGPDVVVSTMAPSGTEVAFGMVNDPLTGPLVMVSAGGLLIEVLEDAVFALPPFDAAEARRLLQRLRIRRLLQGVRGRPTADIDALADALSRFSILVSELGPEVAQIDVNPVIAGPDGCLAVDALVVPKT